MISTMSPRASGLLLAADELHHPFVFPETLNREEILRRLNRLPEDSVESLVIDHRVLTSEVIEAFTPEKRKSLAMHVASEARHLERLQHFLLMKNWFSRSRRDSTVGTRRISNC